jgi:hypothetical protein
LYSVFAKLAQVRRDCAIAGNFENLVTIKMGDKDNWWMTERTNDGNFVSSPDDIPGETIVLYRFSMIYSG